MSGTLPVNRGGTGVISYEALAEKLITAGINSGGVSTTIEPGTFVNWAGTTWLVNEVVNGITYMWKKDPVACIGGRLLSTQYDAPDKVRAAIIQNV